MPISRGAWLLFLASFLVLITSPMPRAQTEIERGATTILGASASSLWFRKLDRVWMVTPGGSVLDTGVPLAGAEVHVIAAHLQVSNGGGVHMIDDLGTVTTTRPPFAYDGVNAARLGTVWRVLTPMTWSDRVAIEIATWNGSGWTSSIRTLYDPAAYGQIETIVTRRDRFLVLWSTSSRTSTFDLLASDSQPIIWNTWSGTCGGSWRWSEGVIFCGEGGGGGGSPGPGLGFVKDGGHADLVDLPSSWGWCGRCWNVSESSIGFPVVWSSNVSQFMGLDGSPGVHANPPIPAHDLFWTRSAPRSYFVTTGTSGATVPMHSRNGSWVPIPGLTGYDLMQPVGELNGAALVVIQSPTGVSELRSIDAITGASVLFLANMTAPPSRCTPYSGGVLLSASTNSTGRELWYVDGETTVARLVADLAPGPADSNPAQLHIANGRAFFVADTGAGPALFALEAAELDWRRSPVNGHWYRLTPPMTWHDAALEAQRDRASLASVLSPDEQQWLRDTFGDVEAWIGLHDLDRDGVFEWVSGASMNYSAWCPGEPTLIPPGQDVVHMAYSASSCVGGWANDYPNRILPGILERTVAPRSIETFGSGCRTSFPRGCADYGPATLEAGSWSASLGSALRLDIDARHLDPSGSTNLGHLALGSDNAQLLAHALPLSLEPFGWSSGCQILVAPLELIAVPLGPYGRGSWSVSIPNDPAMAGVRLYAQGLMIDSYPPCSSATNGIRIVLEVR